MTVALGLPVAPTTQNLDVPRVVVGARANERHAPFRFAPARHVLEVVAVVALAALRCIGFEEVAQEVGVGIRFLINIGCDIWQLHARSHFSIVPLLAVRASRAGRMPKLRKRWHLVARFVANRPGFLSLSSAKACEGGCRAYCSMTWRGSFTGISSSRPSSSTATIARMPAAVLWVMPMRIAQADDAIQLVARPVVAYRPKIAPS